MKPTDDDRPAEELRRPAISNDELFLKLGSDSREELTALRRARTLLEICDSAVALEPELREWFLQRACAGDATLRIEARALLDAIDASCGFLWDLRPDRR